MTPISRLIPQTSGSQAPHRSERETMREHVGGPAMTPPIRPEPSSESRGDDIVSEILRDTEGESDQEPLVPPNHHPSQYQEQEYPGHEHENVERSRMVRFEDEEEYSSPSPTPARSRSQKRDDPEGDSDYIGMILNEMKLPLIVAVLMLGASSTGLDNTITRFLPSFLNMGGSGGMVVKAVVGGLLFYVLHRIFL